MEWIEWRLHHCASELDETASARPNSTVVLRAVNLNTHVLHLSCGRTYHFTGDENAHYDWNAHHFRHIFFMTFVIHCVFSITFYLYVAHIGSDREWKNSSTIIIVSFEFFSRLNNVWWRNFIRNFQIDVLVSHRFYGWSGLCTLAAYYVNHTWLSSLGLCTTEQNRISIVKKYADDEMFGN